MQDEAQSWIGLEPFKTRPSQNASRALCLQLLGVRVCLLFFGMKVPSDDKQNKEAAWPKPALSSVMLQAS